MSDVPLREHIDQRFADLQLHLEKIRESDREQRDILRQEMERRLEGMNEFREQLQMQTATFVTREMFEHYRTLTNDALVSLGNWRSNLEGRMLVIAALPIVVGTVVAVITIWAALSGG